ncbi:MAG: VWA domain-containing protein [Bacteroidetes bacterium]|nr:VWA domain-containing protein [Bacteroidota bacterium]
MKFKKLLLLSYCIPAFLIAQKNYVPNPSFESDVNAPPIQQFNWNKYVDWRKDSLYNHSGNELYLCSGWWQPTSGTPDYLNSDRSYLLGFKTKTARTGEGRMGIIGGIAESSLVTWLFYKDTYAEYIECKLNAPLDSGKMYRVQYYVALDRKSNFSCDHFGAVIARDCMMVKDYHSSFYSYDPTPNVMMHDDHYVTSDEGWVLVCDTFIAKGGEKFLTLGSFMGDFPVRVHSVKPSQHGSLRVAPFNKYAYYYVDDVTLTEVLPEEELCATPRDSIVRDNLVFLIDASGSMAEKGLIDEAKDAITSLTKELPPGDHVTIISYSDEAVVHAEQVRADDEEAIKKALKEVQSGGGTNVVAGFNAAYLGLRKQMITGGNNKIVVLTDGKIYLPAGEKKKILDASTNEGIKVSVIFFGDEVPDDVQKFAESTGGGTQAAKKGAGGDALKAEVPPVVKDTPYGERNAGKIIAWEALTKLLFPAILAAIVLHGMKVI